MKPSHEEYFTTENNERDWMPFNSMACDIQINVGFKHKEKEEVTVENSKTQTNGDTSQELAALFFMGPFSRQW